MQTSVIICNSQSPLPLLIFWSSMSLSKWVEVSTCTCATLGKTTPQKLSKHLCKVAWQLLTKRKNPIFMYQTNQIYWFFVPCTLYTIRHLKNSKSAIHKKSCIWVSIDYPIKSQQKFFIFLHRDQSLYTENSNMSATLLFRIQTENTSVSLIHAHHRY